jgi:hypothetical protein
MSAGFKCPYKKRRGYRVTQKEQRSRWRVVESTQRTPRIACDPRSWDRHMGGFSESENSWPQSCKRRKSPFMVVLANAHSGVRKRRVSSFLVTQNSGCECPLQGVCCAVCQQWTFSQIPLFHVSWASEGHTPAWCKVSPQSPSLHPPCVLHLLLRYPSENDMCSSIGTCLEGLPREPVLSRQRWTSLVSEALCYLEPSAAQGDQPSL